MQEKKKVRYRIYGLFGFAEGVKWVCLEFVGNRVSFGIVWFGCFMENSGLIFLES